MNWRVMLNFVSSVVAFFFPIFNAWCFFPFNKELDWEWEKKKRAGNKEAEESNSAIKIHPGCKEKKIGLLHIQKWISVCWTRQLGLNRRINWIGEWDCDIALIFRCFKHKHNTSNSVHWKTLKLESLFLVNPCLTNFNWKECDGIFRQ